MSALQELQEYRQWVAWRYDKNEHGELSKVPYNPHTRGKASSTKPTTWGTYDQASERATRGNLAGVGFVFTPDDPFCGIDLDDCIDDAGNMAAWAADIIGALNTYAEISPSGHGVKLWGRASLPGVGLNTQLFSPLPREFYDRGRYFTFTGRHLPGTPDTINGCQAAVTALYEAARAEQVRAKYAPAALASEVRDLTRAPDGARNDTLNKASFSMGQLVGAGVLDQNAVEGELTRVAVNIGLGEEEIRATMRSGLTAGMQKPRDLPAVAPAPMIHRNGTHPPQGEESRADTPPTYWADVGRAGTPILRWAKPTADGPIPTILAHFTVRVIGERVRHKADGSTARVITCEVATARGVRVVDVLPEDLADSRRFYGCCVHAVGADARLVTSAAVKHLPLAAFELADPDRERSEVYEFCGWHEEDGRLVYLSAGGAIGTDRPLTVDLAGLALGAGVPTLASFGPRDDGELSRALQALAGPVRQCFPDLVTLPGLAAVFLAPLLRWAPTVDRPALHYIGTSGVRKSAWLALLQSFYGLTEPALSWRGTANSIEIALSALRDCLVTVDDLKTATSDRDAGVKIIQSYADRRGRSRATRTGELARARFVGGLLVSAGEDVPAGEASVAARSLFVPIGATDANLAQLTAAQDLAPHLATITAHYLSWLIERQADIAGVLAEVFVQARARYRRLLADRSGINDAGRVATNCALLEAGITVGVSWLQHCGWSTADISEWIRATRATLDQLARLQQETIGEESAARAFLAALRALIDGRRLELYTVTEPGALPALSGCSPTYQGAVVCGWRVGDAILLQPDLSLAEVRRWLASQGRSLPTERGLYAQLKDGQYLAEIDKDGKTPVVKRINNGKTQRVLVLHADAIDSAD